MAVATTTRLLDEARAGVLGMKPETLKAVPKDGWVMEPKYDGARMLVGVEDKVRLMAFSGNEHTGKLRVIEEELAALPAGTWLDAELVALTVNGPEIICDWGAAQSIMSSNTVTDAQAEGLTLMVFDVLSFGGVDARGQEYVERRAFLERMFEGYDFERIALTMQLEASDENHEALVRAGFEGSMLKRLDSKYLSGRRGAGWGRIKAVDTADLVVLGYEWGEDSFSDMIGALVIGQPDESGTMVERGKVGTGWTIAERRRMTEERDTLKGRVIEIRHNRGATELRHPVFVRWRDDKKAEEVEWHDA